MTTVYDKIFFETASTYITSRLVKALGLTTKQIPYVKSGVPLPPGTPTEMVSISHLRVGGMEINDVRSYVSDFTVENMKDQNVDGILGTDFLKYFGIVFDFENKNLLLIPGGHLTDAQLTDIGMTGGVGSRIVLKGLIDAPLRMLAPVQVELNEQKFSVLLIIDTGSKFTSLYNPNNALKLKQGQRGAPRYQFGLTGLTMEYVFPVTAFSVGDKKQDAKRTGLAPFECGVVFAKSITPSLLGLDYLSHFRVLIDYPARRLYLTPVPNPSGLPFPTESSRQCASLTVGDAKLTPSADGKWEVVSIQKDGVFGKAGVQAGDVIETINGKKTDGLLLYGLSSLFIESGDKPAVLQLRRDGKIVQVSVDLMPKL